MDFDGDALNALSLKDAYLVDSYYIFEPRHNMVISKNDGLFDDNFNLIKDQIICLHQFCKLGNKNKIKILPKNSKHIVKIEHRKDKDEHKSKKKHVVTIVRKNKKVI